MTQHLTLEQIDQLGELLAGIPEPFVPMEADMLDGYLTAIALLKTPPALEDWLPLVFDMQGSNRAKLADPQRQATLRKLILARGAEIEAQILSEKPIDPIIYDDESDSEDEFAALAPFADGFAFACSAWPELLKSQNKAVQAALVGVLRYESKQEQADDDAEVEEVLSGIEEEVAFADLDEALADLAACVQEIAEVTRERDIEAAKKAKPARRR